MKAGEDPRTDRSTDGPKQPTEGTSDGKVHPAPGGVGTGTAGDPAKEPAAQPHKQR